MTTENSDDAVPVRYVEPPSEFTGAGPAVFLAGGITGCEDWQSRARQLLASAPAALLNPRRVEFPIDDPSAAAGQVDWEYRHLRRADVVLFWFPAAPGPHPAVQPIALYELGAHAATGKPIAVGCDPGYPRRADVVLQLGHARPDVIVRDTLAQVCADAVALLRPSSPGPSRAPDRPSPDLTIAPLAGEHWPAVREIYAAGIATGHATFESEPPSWQKFDASKLPAHRHVALDDAGNVLGWVAATSVSDRCVYAGVVEHSVYVHPDARGRGVGLLLLDALIASTRAAGIWTIQSGVFPENSASLALHRAAGFRVIGTRERVGRMTTGSLAGRWRDVILLERRVDPEGD